MTGRRFILIAVVGVAILVAADRIRRAAGPAPATPYQGGSAQNVVQAIRAGLEGTHTACDMGAPTAEQRANWFKLRAPRENQKLRGPQLFALPDNDLAYELSSRALDDLYTTGLGGMTVPEQNVYLLWTLEAEVRNGGFQQFFGNSSGDCALLTTRAVADLGHAPLVDTYAAALKAFPNSAPPEDRATRNQLMEKLPDEYRQWSDIDGRFFKLELDPLVAAYARRNAPSFDSPN
jgi:hypothetical protein